MAVDRTARDYVAAVGRAARAEAAALAADLRARDAAALDAPSACTEWAVRDVVAHLTDGAERAALVARAAVEGAPVPQYSREERDQRMAALRPLSGEELAARLERGTSGAYETLEAADEAALRDTVVPLAAGPHTLQQFAAQRLVETTLHAWDVRAPRDPAAPLPPDSAALAVDYLLWRVQRQAKADRAPAGMSTCLWQLEGPGGGPATLTVRDGQASGARGAPPAPDLTLRLPVEAWVRFVWGRLDLARALDAGTVRTTSSREQALALGRMFPGI